MNFNKFWYVDSKTADSKMAEIVCYIYISTLPDSCHYTTLLKANVLNFYLTLVLLQSDCLHLVSK